MGEAANPFEAVRAMMLENLEKVQSATQSYMDTVEKAMRGLPGANDEQIATFKAYIERKVAANRDFVEKLLRAKDFQEAVRIQVEYLQSQLKAAAEDASQIGTKIASSLNRSMGYPIAAGRQGIGSRTTTETILRWIAWRTHSRNCVTASKYDMISATNLDVGGRDAAGQLSGANNGSPHRCDRGHRRPLEYGFPAQKRRSERWPKQNQSRGTCASWRYRNADAN